jgi:hypothetical protein
MKHSYLEVLAAVRAVLDTAATPKVMLTNGLGYVNPPQHPPAPTSMHERCRVRQPTPISMHEQCWVRPPLQHPLTLFTGHGLGYSSTSKPQRAPLY